MNKKISHVGLGHELHYSLSTDFEMTVSVSVAQSIENDQVLKAGSECLLILFLTLWSIISWFKWRFWGVYLVSLNKKQQNKNPCVESRVYKILGKLFFNIDNRTQVFFYLSCCWCLDFTWIKSLDFYLFWTIFPLLCYSFWRIWLVCNCFWTTHNTRRWSFTSAVDVVHFPRLFLTSFSWIFTQQPAVFAKKSVHIYETASVL